MTAEMGGVRRHHAALCAVVIALLASPAVHAAPVFHPATRVVLFTPAASDPLVARLEAELAAVGIQVRKVSMPPEGQLDAAVSREIASGASAAIRVIPRSRGAEVWTGETTARVVRRQATGSDTSDLSVIALRTVEFLRATLLEVKNRPPAAASGAGAGAAPATTERGAGPAAALVETQAPQPPTLEATATPGPSVSTPPRDTAPPPPRAGGAKEGAPPARPVQSPTVEEASAPPAKTERLPEWGLKAPPEVSTSEPLHLQVSAGPAWIGSPGGVSPIAGVAVMGRGHVSEQAGLELMSIFPLSPSHLSNVEGTVAFKTALFGAAVVFHVAAARRLRADVAFGASAIMFRAAGTGMGGVGTASAPNVGSVETQWKVAGHARVGGGWDLNRWLSVRADVIGGLTERTTVGYDVTDVGGQTMMNDRASWGPAFAVVSAGLQASW